MLTTYLVLSASALINRYAWTNRYHPIGRVDVVVYDPVTVSFGATSGAEITHFMMASS